MSLKYNPLLLSLKYLLHLLTARNTKGFGVHSPYLFDFVRNVLMERKPFYVFEEIEFIRKGLLQNKTKLNILDLGSGKDRKTSISRIAQRSLKPKRQSQLLFRIVNHYKFNHLLELGTSFGISTLYLASVSSNSKCISLEGIPLVAEIAKNNFDKLNRNNIELIVGNIDQTLSSQINKEPFEFVFMDANHRYEPMKKYFDQIIQHTVEGSILVIDDIHYSTEMEKFWHETTKHPRITSSIDIFHMGILFTKSHLKQKNYKIHFNF